MADKIVDAYRIDDTHSLLITASGARLWHDHEGKDEDVKAALQDYLDKGGKIKAAKQATK